MAVLFVVSYIPYTVNSLVQGSDHLANLLAKLPALLNTAGNPVIYSFTNLKFRGYVRGLFCREGGVEQTMNQSAVEGEVTQGRGQG